ncbi:MAG: DUF4390 domain-containing protein [Thermoanaerobaculia bacterium]|nr:DUF4390 domain-containing protein [Thermoanaerobaculia bacterium]
MPILAVILTAPLLAAARLFAAEEPLGIPEVRTTLAGSEVRVEAHLHPGLPEEVVRRLLAGIPTTVAWEMRLFVKRRNWFDSLKDERRYEVTATWRPVSGDYAIERRLDGRLLDTVVVPGREEAVAALSRLPGIPGFTSGPALAGAPLVVRVRSLYGTGVALGFVPTRAMTDWRTSPVFSWNGRPGGP